MSLAGCGGGSSLDSTADGPVSLHGSVDVCAAAPGSAARVSVPYGEGQEYTATTNEDGSYSLELHTADFRGVDPVALSIEAENCQPENIYIENITGAVLEGTLNVAPKVMQDLGPAEFVVPPPWKPLTHLGNDVYGGPANSGLQVATTGLAAEQLVGVFTQELKDQYSKAYVEFDVRGMQTESLQCATEYANQIGLSASGVSLEPIVKTVQPGASSGDGRFSSFSIPIDLSDVPAGSTINFVASSGQCNSGGADYDDFELTGVLVRLVP